MYDSVIIFMEVKGKGNTQITHMQENQKMSPSNQASNSQAYLKLCLCHFMLKSWLFAPFWANLLHIIGERTW